MRVPVRLLVSLTVLGLGLAAGISLSAILSGSSASDPCFGEGTLDSRVTNKDENGSQEFTICTKVGQRVIFDANGTPVDVTVRDEEVAEYYKTHPAENPRVIADKTADADIANNSFVEVELPVPLATDCPPAAVRTKFERVGISLCVPDGWQVVTDDSQTIDIGTDWAVVGFSTLDVTDTAGTRCAKPQLIDLKSGHARFCAGKEVAGGRGHGIILASGRNGGMSLTKPVTAEQRELALQVLFSVEELSTAESDVQ